MIAVQRNGFKSEKLHFKKEILQSTDSEWDINHKKPYSNNEKLKGKLQRTWDKSEKKTALYGSPGKPLEMLTINFTAAKILPLPKLEIAFIQRREIYSEK